jgi:hypothetical protein
MLDFTEFLNQIYFIRNVISAAEYFCAGHGKPFLMGESPTDTDCYAFAVLSQILWGHESILREKLKGALLTFLLSW